MATAKKKQQQLEALEDQMRTLALAIDSSYARTGFSPDNIRLNREFDALEALYNNTTTTTTSAIIQQTTAKLQRTTSTHGHLFSISRKNLIRARAARSSSYFATAASSFIGSPIRQLRGGASAPQQEEGQTPKKQQQQLRRTAQSARPAAHQQNKAVVAPVARAKARARFLGD